MTTHAQPPPPTDELAPDNTLDAEARLGLYATMVLCRTYEEAILREYHADKGPGFDIGKGLVPGEMHLSAGQEPVAAGVCAHLTADDAVTATHRPHHLAIAHGVDLRRDDRRDLRPRDRPRPRPRRPHAPVRPRHPLLLLRHHRRGLPAGPGPGVRLPAQGHRPDRRRGHRRGRRQPGRLPRVAQPGGAVAAAGRLRRRGQRLGRSRCRGRVHRASPSNADRAAGYGIPGERVEDNDVEAVYAAAAAGRRPGPRRRGPSPHRGAHAAAVGALRGRRPGLPARARRRAERDPIPRYEQRAPRRPACSTTRRSPGSEDAAGSASRTPSPSPRTARCPTRRRPPSYVFA